MPSTLEQLERLRPPSFVVHLSPLPAWARAIAGKDAAGPGVLVLHRGELHLQVGRARFAIGRHRVVRLHPRKGRVPVVGSEATVARHRPALDWVRARLGWIGSVVYGGSAGADRYAPTKAEQGYAGLYQWMVEGAEAPERSGVEAVDRFAEELGAYRELEAEDWERLFARADADLSRSWLAAIVHGVAGHMAAIRDAYAEAPDSPPSPLDVLQGRALALLRFDAQALDRIGRGLTRMPPRGRADVLLPMADLAARLGDRDRALQLARQSIVERGNDLRFLPQGVARLLELGAVGDAYLVLDDASKRFPESSEIALVLGELYAWGGHYERAEALAERATGSADSARVEKLRAIASYGRGELEEALRRFESAAGSGKHRAECYTFMAEIHLRLGNRDRADYYQQRSRVRAQGAAHSVLVPLIEKDYTGRPLVSLWRRFHPEAPQDERPSTEALERFAKSVLGWMRGNRTERLTYSRAEGPVLPSELERVPPEEEGSLLASRNQSSDLTKKTATHDFEEVLSELGALAEKYPESPHPFCYRGEVLLWLGELDRAYADFEEALVRRSARWAWVGKGAVHALRGELEPALRLFDECGKRFQPVVGPTTHVYLGELYRSVGKLEEARRELALAVEAKPGRVGAWMNLALVHEATGETEEARAIFERLTTQKPRLLWDVRRALGGDLPWPLPFSEMRPVFLEALRMMRGNRSSHLVTYFDHEGVFRTAQDGPKWADQAAKWRHLLHEELVFRLASARAWEPS